MLSSLHPATEYNICCIGKSKYGEMAESPLSTMKKMKTLRPILQISKERVVGNSIEFLLKTNVPFSPTCVLFNELCRNGE